MFSEVLKIVPKLDASGLSQMERTLSSRFANVSKKFGKGLFSAIKGVGVIGIATTLIDKLLNPLKETQDAIDRTLKNADDVVTNAQQFGTTAGKLFKLQKFAQATGLDQESLNTLLVKYQGALAEAKADPKKATSVRAFANDTDIAESFFQFIQQLNKMERSQQVLVQQEVFGEKQTLKMADFLRADFAKIQAISGLKSAETYTGGLEKTAGLNDLADALKAGQEANDTLKKSGIINQGMITARSKQEQVELDKENKRIASYDNLAQLNMTSQKIMGLVEEGVIGLGKLVTVALPTINKLSDSVKKMSESRFFRGIFGNGKDN